MSSVDWMRRSLGVVVGILLGLLLAEGGMRLLNFPRPPLRPARIEGRVPLLPLGGDLFVYRADSSFTYRYDPAGDPQGYFGPDGRLTYRMNNIGLRGPDVKMEGDPGSYRILCLGDSYTFGEGVRDEDTYPAQLEKILETATAAAGKDSSGVEVINAGVQAMGTRLEALLLERLIRLEPDLVILGFFLNDAMANPETIRLQEQDWERAELRRKVPSRLVATVWGRWQAVSRQRKYLQSIRESFATPGWDECRRYLAEMKELTDRSDTRFLVVIFPVLWKLDEGYPFADLHRKVGEECARLGCESLDLWPVYRGREASALWAHPTDPHPNREAHALAARAIADRLTALGWVAPGHADR